MTTPDAMEGGHRPLVGFLAARFDEAYQHEVWTGASREALRLGLDLVFFSGQRILSPIGNEALDNVAFDLAERSGLAGLVVMANVIGTFVSREEEESFIARFRGVPVVTIGLEFPGIPCVAADPSGGMSSVAEHLALKHGLRRFLFLAGPSGHPESEARRLEFSEALRGFAPEAVIELLQGDFTEEDAAQKMAGRLESTGRGLDPGFEAVVAANDLMAFGAMRALAARGLEVPRDVAVTGFDDTDDSRFSAPPLTTVRQPIAGLGALAMRKVADALGRSVAVGPVAPGSGDGLPFGAVPPKVRFVRRQSCGCPFGDDEETQREAAGTFAEEDPGKGCVTDIEALVDEVNADLRSGRSPAHLRGRRFEPERRALALLAIAEGEARFLTARRMEAERRFSILGEIQSSLISSFGLEDILSETARGARELGISACWLCLFEGGGRSTEWSSLLLASLGEETRILAPRGLRFRTCELVPGGLPQRWPRYVCEPLCFGEDRLGYMVCTEDASDRRGYEALRDQVSAAIKGALLMAAERDRERELESKVRERTLELSAANERLVEEMSRRKALERELLGISNRIMGDIGRDIHDNLCQDIAGLGIMAAVLEGQLRRSGDQVQAEAAASLARTAGETAAKAKGMARGLYPAELEAKGGLVRAVERLVESARDRAGAKGPDLELEVSRGFAVRDPEKALHLLRIVQEALQNAQRHSGASRIRIGLSMDRENVSVEVEDDGRGIQVAGRQEEGMGLKIMKYRASVIGGELRVRALEHGTAVSCRAPR